MSKTVTKELLPPMPQPHPTLRITVDAVLNHDFERYSDGSMRMTYERCDVSEGEGGKPLGYVSVTMPVGVVVKVGSRSYYLSPMALWNAVADAEAKEHDDDDN